MVYVCVCMRARAPTQLHDSTQCGTVVMRALLGWIDDDNGHRRRSYSQLLAMTTPFGCGKPTVVLVIARCNIQTRYGTCVFPWAVIARNGELAVGGCDLHSCSFVLRLPCSKSTSFKFHPTSKA